MTRPVSRSPTRYWAGKGLGRAARIAEIADQLGNTAIRDKALATMKSTMNNWLTASPGRAITSSTTTTTGGP